MAAEGARTSKKVCGGETDSASIEKTKKVPSVGEKKPRDSRREIINTSLHVVACAHKYTRVRMKKTRARQNRADPATNDSGAGVEGRAHQFEICINYRRRRKVTRRRGALNIYIYILCIYVSRVDGIENGTILSGPSSGGASVILSPSAQHESLPPEQPPPTRKPPDAGRAR